jgi:two-component system, NarL family, nitrate/nitrite response regulator NarL
MRLVLGDDQAIFLDALATVLTERGYEVGGVARCAEELVAYVHHQRPDACLIDGSPVTGDGAATIRRVIQASQVTAVLILGADPCATAAELALEAGAVGYLHQSRGVEVLVAALERISAGERVVDLPDTGSPRKPRRVLHADAAAATLTSRERECLSLLVAGLDTTAIMARMGVSRTTVRTHLQAVLTKLGVHSRLEAASFAVRHRLLDTWAMPDAASGRYRVLNPGAVGRAAAGQAGAVSHRPGIPAIAGAQHLGSARPPWPGSAGLAASGLSDRHHGAQGRARPGRERSRAVHEPVRTGRDSSRA